MGEEVWGHQEVWGQACKIAIQEIAFNNNFMASANSESFLEWISSRFTPALDVLTSLPIRLLSSARVPTPSSNTNHAAIPLASDN
jgi:hypothetical protein